MKRKKIRSSICPVHRKNIVQYRTIKKIGVTFKTWGHIQKHLKSFSRPP